MAKGSSIKTLVVVSDIHAGSTSGLLPANFETLEGNAVKQNKFQAWLWSQWETRVSETLEKIGSSPFAVVLNGDALEGVHHGGHQIISTDATDHVRAAEQVLEPLIARASQKFVVYGTECHTATRENSLGKSIGAEKCDETNAFAWDHLPLTVHGCLNSFRHHVGTTARVYLESSQYSIAAVNERMEAARAGWPIPKMVWRAHRHRGGKWDDGVWGMCVTGGWQGITRHGHKAVPGAIPMPSIALADWRGRSFGSLPQITNEPCLPPAPRGVTL